VSRFCRCGTALARDNSSRLCSACQATRQRIRPPELPPEFWQTEVMAAALDSGDLGQVLRAYRCHPRIVFGHKPDVAICNVRLPPTFSDEGLRAAIERASAIPASVC
jgi:hypothetical protein